MTCFRPVSTFWAARVALTLYHVSTQSAPILPLTPLTPLAPAVRPLGRAYGSISPEARAGIAGRRDGRRAILAEMGI